MSARRSARRARLFAASSTVAVTVALVGFGGSVASADPPALDPETCSNTLDRAQFFPGTLGDDVRLVSDGFDSYLARHPSCQTET
jgi:hypothetical protein